MQKLTSLHTTVVIGILTDKVWLWKSRITTLTLSEIVPVIVVPKVVFRVVETIPVGDETLYVAIMSAGKTSKISYT